MEGEVIMKRKILIVINSSWNVFNFRLGLLLALQEEGNEIIVVAPRDAYTEKLEEIGFEYHDVAINAKGMNPIEDTKLTYSLYKLYKRIKPDVILHYTIKPNIYGSIAADILKIPTINNIAGLGTLFIEQNIVTTLAKLLYKYSQTRTAHIFFQNNDDLELFVNENLVDAQKCDVLPGSGIDVTTFCPIENTKDGMVRFLLIARMLWAKGVGEYIEAAKIIKAKYDNIEFQLLGCLAVANRSAITHEQMQVWVDSHLVNYLGTTSNVKKYICKADCVVLPSYYREGTPRTLLESASMAKPLITTHNVGCKDVVDHGINGYLCQPKNVDDLVEQLEKFIHLSDTEREEMGIKGREKMINEFDEKIVITKYSNMIKEVC